MQPRRSSSSSSSTDAAAEPNADASGNSFHHEWTYSEGISISRVGPSRDCYYATRLDVDGKQNFKETVVFENRWLPHVYYTSVAVDTPYGTNAQYVESIGFKPRWVARLFAETVYSYPREANKTQYATTFVYDPDSVQCRYVSGLRICASANCVDLGQVDDCSVDLHFDPKEPTDDRDGPSPKSPSDRSPFSPGRLSRSRQWQQDILERCENGFGGGSQHPLKGVDENCNLFNNTKELLIN